MITLVCQLRQHRDQLVNVQKLHPRLKLLFVLLPDELALRGATEERGRTLVVLLLDLAVVTHDGDLGLPEPELPALERIAVAPRALAGDVELEARPVEADGLADRLDVRLLESEEEAEAAEDDFGFFAWGDEGHFEGCQLEVVSIWCDLHRKTRRTLWYCDSAQSMIGTSGGVVHNCFIPSPRFTTSRCLPWVMTIPTRLFSHARWYPIMAFRRCVGFIALSVSCSNVPTLRTRRVKHNY